MPTRCVEPQPSRTCEESAPLPGTCLCQNGGCTLKPHRAPIASAPCQPRACVVDRAAGRCIADSGGVPENFRTNPGLSSGPSCDCITPERGCTFQWFEPIPCKTALDCWVAEEPRPHPIRRPPALRKRSFKPCTSDGEIEPECSSSGRCVLGPSYLC